MLKVKALRISASCILHGPLLCAVMFLLIDLKDGARLHGVKNCFVRFPSQWPAMIVFIIYVGHGYIAVCFQGAESRGHGFRFQG